MKLLIPVDFSPSSEAVVGEITARPRPAGTEALVLNVVDVMGIGSGVMDIGSILEKDREDARELVNTIAGRLSSAGIKSSGDVIIGRPRSAIPIYAKEWGADFIILGSHGHSGLVRFLLGGVAKAVLRGAPCSIEIIRAASANTTSATPPKILLATEGSRYSLAAVRSVASRPWPPASEFKVVSFADVPPFCRPPLDEAEHDSTLDEVCEEIISAAQEAVKPAQAILQEAGLNSMAAVSVGDPRTGILDEASHWGARLIVVGSHGISATRGVAPGIVAETVALHAHCSVEVIRLSEPA